MRCMRSRVSPTPRRSACSRPGARPISFDLAEHDLSPLPRSIDVVINYGVLPPNNAAHYEVNAGAMGRLARRYREAFSFKARDIKLGVLSSERSTAEHNSRIDPVPGP